MGITHFAGLGKSPGAVTTGLSYLKCEEGNKPDQYGNIVENVVIFTSPEIVDGGEKAFSSECNEYMNTVTHEKWADNLTNSFKILREFCRRELKEVPLYVCKVNTNDYRKCFEEVAKALLRFHPPGKVGKHIWANLTGGTNILNATFMQVSHLSGFIPMLYYTFISDLKKYGKFLRPFSRDENKFYFQKIPILKTMFDEKYQYTLETLKKKKMTSGELLSRLKRNHPRLFSEMKPKTFKRNYLNTMSGVKRKEGNKNMLNESGRAALEMLQRPLFKAIVRGEEEYSQDKINELIRDSKLKRVEYSEG